MFTRKTHIIMFLIFCLGFLHHEPETLDSALSRLDRQLRLAESIDAEEMVEKLKSLYIRNGNADLLKDHLLIKAYEELHDKSSAPDHPSWPAMTEQEKIAYLVAKQAKKECYVVYTESRYLALAEEYASIALKYLAICPDSRLELDILQCISTMNYMLKSNIQIAEILFEYAIESAQKVDHPLRHAGLMYNLANLYVQSHRYSEAKQLANQTIEFAHDHMNIQWMDDYFVKCQSIIATILMKNERYEKSLALCAPVLEGVEQGIYTTDLNTKANLKLVKGLNHKELAHFDDAEAIFNEILQEDTTTSIRCEALASLSHLYYDWSIYGMAYVYADSALKILTAFTPENKHDKCRYLIYCAQSSLEQGETERAAKLIAEAGKIVGSIEFPHLQAEVYNSLGDYYQQNSKYEIALIKYRDALDITKGAGLTDFAKTIQLEIGKCHTTLENWQQAEKILEDIVNGCDGNLTRPCELEAQGLLASAYSAQGEINMAIKAANNLTRQIKVLGNDLNDLNNRVNFRHSIYKYLKNAAYFEIQNDRSDSAFIKLDFAKSILIKSAQTGDHRAISLNAIQNSLSPQEALLSYMVGDDGCFLFFVNKDTLICDPLDIDEGFVTNFCANYRRNIETAASYYAQGSKSACVSNFQAIEQQGVQLWQRLFKILQKHQLYDNLNTIYIVPDDALYGIPYSCAVKDSSFLIEDIAIVRLSAAASLPGIKNQKSDRTHFRLLYAVERSFAGADRLCRFFKNAFNESNELSVQSSQWAKSQVLSTLESDYDIIFLYGHSKPNPVNPDQSILNISIFLEDDKKYITHPFTMAELKKVNWHNSETVILFGCQTGIGMELSGIGYFGFQQSVLALGAPQVIATLWEVDSQFAHFHAIDLFKQWQSGKSFVKALQTIQKNEIKNLVKSSHYQVPHPYFWAAYTIMQAGV